MADGSQVIHAERAHAKLAPSAAARWMACPGSVRLSETVPEEPSSEYAKEGTRAHEMSERALRAGVTASELWKNEFPANDLDAFEMAKPVDRYIEYVTELGGTLYIETRVEHLPGEFGTADALVVSEDGKTLHVVDLKYGKGVQVFAENNKQLMCYALGALKSLDFFHPEIRNVVLTVAQPRLDHIDEWEIGAEGLRSWAEDELEPAAELTKAEGAPFNPGEDQCRWCPARGICPALAAEAADFVTDEFSYLHVQPDALDAEQVAQLLPHGPLVKLWAEAVEKQAKKLALAGETIPGHKLVAGRSIRKWADDEEAFAALKKTKKKLDEVAPRKIVSPAGAEKLFGKTKVPKALFDLITAPPGAPTLVPDSDKRPALSFNPAEGFEDQTT